MRDLIDVSIYVDTPLDIAMARRIIRDFKDKSIIELHKDLNHYITPARKAYVEASKR